MPEQNFKEFIAGAPVATKARLVLLAISAVVVLVLTTYSIRRVIYYYQGPSLTESILLRAPASIPERSVPYEIKDMSIGFMNRKGTRTAYAQFTLILDCTNEACKNNLALQRAKVLDIIFEVGGDFYLEDFSHPLAKAGFASFKGRILELLQKNFHSLAPREVLLKEWFMN